MTIENVPQREPTPKPPGMEGVATPSDKEATSRLWKKPAPESLASSHPGGIPISEHVEDVPTSTASNESATSATRPMTAAINEKIENVAVIAVCFATLPLKSPKC